MLGMNKDTGKLLGGYANLQQRLQDVISTPVGSRVMRRAYGCDVFSLVDSAVNDTTMVQIYAAVADAVSNPENGLDDFALDRIQVTGVGDRIHIDLLGRYRKNNQIVTVTGVVL